MTNKEFEDKCDKIKELVNEIIKGKQELELEDSEIFEFIEMNTVYTVDNLKTYFGIEDKEE